jgi:hypothetical protein
MPAAADCVQQKQLLLVFSARSVSLPLWSGKTVQKLCAWGPSGSDGTVAITSRHFSSFLAQ